MGNVSSNRGMLFNASNADEGDFEMDPVSANTVGRLSAIKESEEGDPNRK